MKCQRWNSIYIWIYRHRFSINCFYFIFTSWYFLCKKSTQLLISFFFHQNLLMAGCNLNIKQTNKYLFQSTVVQESGFPSSGFFISSNITPDGSYEARVLDHISRNKKAGPRKSRLPDNPVSIFAYKIFK